MARALGRVLQEAGWGRVGCGMSGEDAVRQWDGDERGVGQQGGCSGQWDGLSGMQDAHLNKEAVLQRRDVLAVAADLRQSQSGASCVIPFPPRTPTSARHQQPQTSPPPAHPCGTPDDANTLLGTWPHGGHGTKRRVKPLRTTQPPSQLTHWCWGQGTGD